MELCPGVTERFDTVKADLQMDKLKFDACLLEAFQSARLASQRFKLRLIELTAVSLHQIAVKLFQLNLNLHDSATTGGLDVDAVVKWKPEPDPFLVNIEPWPTHFARRAFTAHRQYPNDVAEIVGYWAEDRIFGGVVLFDRSKTWTEDSEPDFYFQSCRYMSTWRIWQVLPDQQEDLVNFLQDRRSSNDLTVDLNGPLPIMPSRANKVRVDPIDTIRDPLKKIYRDLWDRPEPPKLLRMQKYMEPCIRLPIDYSEMEDPDVTLKRLNELWESDQKRRIGQ